MDTYTFRTATSMALMDCIDCGVAWLMPEELRRRRLQDHRNYFCPNGHPQHYCGDNEEEDKPGEVEDRRALILKLHRAEQAEAREAEGVEAKQAEAMKLAATVNRGSDGAVPCPLCGKGYKILTCLQSHVRCDHQDDALCWALKQDEHERRIGSSPPGYRTRKKNQPSTSSTGQSTGDEAADVKEV